MSVYLVTGGGGFIGSHIAEALVRDGHEVRIIDNFSTGKRENIESFRDNCKVIEKDIRERAAVEEAMKGVEYVIHQAALASVPRSIEDPLPTDEVNVHGTLILLKAAKDNGVKRFVYASSSSVYGDSEKLPKVETMPTNPRSPYAASKLAAEWYCRVFFEIYELPTVSLRYFNVFGPRQDPDSQYSAVIPLFVKALMEGKSPTIFGDGEQSRDFTFVENVVRANLLACQSDTRGGAVYNVACGTRFTLNSLYERLKDIIGAKNTAVFAPPRAGDVKHSEAAIGAIENAFGYKVNVGFEEGLRRAVEWYKEAGVG